MACFKKLSQEERKLSQENNDQAFLNAAVQGAAHSGNESESRLVLLQYQEAMLQALQRFERCEQCAVIDTTLLNKRIQRLLDTAQRYISSVAIISTESVQDLIKETMTLLGDVAQLCPACQQRIQSDILATFHANAATR
jgi:hypothetical protein